jgi:hypothetical protein
VGQATVAAQEQEGASQSADNAGWEQDQEHSTADAGSEDGRISRQEEQGTGGSNAERSAGDGDYKKEGNPAKSGGASQATDTGEETGTSAPLLGFRLTEKQRHEYELNEGEQLVI